MRTAWGMFRALRMTGLDDRGDFYQFWYAFVELEPGEQLVKSWRAFRDPRNLLGGGGNLILSNRRLIYEPVRNLQAAHGQYGTKLVINALARHLDKKGTATPFAIPFGDLRQVTATGTSWMSTLTITDRTGASAEFLVSPTRPPVGSRHRVLRDEAIARISATIPA